MSRALLDRAARTAGHVSTYAVVPFALSLLAFENVVQTATAGGFHVSVKFALPTAIATLWTVFDPPSTGLNFVTPTSLSILPVFVLVEAVLAAGYLGGIHDAAHNRGPSFGENVGEYAVSVLGVRLVEYAVVGTFAFLLVGSGSFALAFVAFPFVFLAGYLLWGAPFLVVARDATAVDAIAWSVSLALEGGRYLTFSLLFALAVAVASLVISPVLSAGGIAAVVLAAALVAFPSLVASAAAMLVVEDVAAAAPVRTA